MNLKTETFLLCGSLMKENPRIVCPGIYPSKYSSIPWRSKIPIKDKILPPTVIAKYSSNGEINVDAFVFLDNALGLKRKDFKYFYNLTMGLKATYELLIYIAFSEPVSKNTSVKNYDITSFQFTFKQDSLKGFNFNTEKEQFISLEEISTVKVFVVNSDPDTSRGTETTVQDDDDD